MELPFNSHHMDETSENVDEYMFLSLGYLSKKNEWAGPDHWKYRKAKGMDHLDGDVQLCFDFTLMVGYYVAKCETCFLGAEDDSIKESELDCGSKKVGKKKEVEPDIDFMKALDEEMPDIFSQPKNPKSLLLSSKRPPCNTRLPEDCHYQPQDLVKLFLLPNVLVSPTFLGY